MSRAPKRLRIVGLATCAAIAGLALASPAGATTYSASDAFYFFASTTAGNGAIATSPDGNYVYVAAGNVTQYTSDGAFVREFARNKHFGVATSIGTDLSGDVFVLYPKSETVVRYTASGKYITRWAVTFARAIGVSRGGEVYVLSNFLNAVGEYNEVGKSIGGFVANFPGQFFPWTASKPDPGIVPDSGYDPPYKTDATAITVAPSGDPVLVGDSYQELSDQPPQCNSHYAFEPPSEFPDPLVSGEAVRFTPSGTLPAWGWLTESSRDCIGGWQSDGTQPDSVAVDPNTGQVYATSPVDLGVIPAGFGVSPYSDQANPHGNINASAPPCYSVDCAGRQWDLIADNPPVGVALDCHSNMYMLSSNAGGVYVAKFLNEDLAQASSCASLSRFVKLPRATVFAIHPTIKIGKESVLMGCSGKLCTGTLSLRSASPLCRNCTLTTPQHFRIRPGLQKTLLVRLSPRGRELLRAHPGLTVEVVGKLRGGHGFTKRTTLKAPATLGARCVGPGTVGGGADVSGTLSPAQAGRVVTVDYFPPQTRGLLLPAVQHTVRTNRAGHFFDRDTLDASGRWTVFASWAGNGRLASAVSRPCSFTVAPDDFSISVTPSSGSVDQGDSIHTTIETALSSGASQSVSLSASGAPGPVTFSPGTISTGGTSNVTISAPATATPGTYAITLTATGPWATHWTTYTLTVRTPTHLSLACSPDPNRRFISCNGRLTTAGGTAIGNAQIQIAYTPPPGSGQQPTVDETATAADGTYSDTLNAPAGSLLASGNWQVQASFGGDSTNSPASTTQNVSVP